MISPGNWDATLGDAQQRVPQRERVEDACIEDRDEGHFVAGYGRSGTAPAVGRHLPVAAGQFLGEPGDLVELFAARAVALLAVGE